MKTINWHLKNIKRIQSELENMTTKQKQGRPKKTGNSVIKQHNVGVPEYMMDSIKEQGKVNQISFSGYVRTLIENDLKQVPTLLTS